MNDIQTYIAQARATGMTDDAIRAQLLASGWPEAAFAGLLTPVQYPAPASFQPAVPQQGVVSQPPQSVVSTAAIPQGYQQAVPVQPAISDIPRQASLHALTLSIMAISAATTLLIVLLTGLVFIGAYNSENLSTVRSMANTLEKIFWPACLVMLVAVAGLVAFFLRLKQLRQNPLAAMNPKNYISSTLWQQNVALPTVFRVAGLSLYIAILSALAVTILFMYLESKFDFVTYILES